MTKYAYLKLRFSLKLMLFFTPQQACYILDLLFVIRRKRIQYVFLGCSLSLTYPFIIFKTSSEKKKNEIKTRRSARVTMDINRERVPLGDAMRSLSTFVSGKPRGNTAYIRFHETERVISTRAHGATAHSRVTPLRARTITMFVQRSRRNDRPSIVLSVMETVR